MNIEQLHYICEVASKGSLSSAARSSNITLSAISQSITALEAELGVPLFSRSRGSGATLTPEGSSIVKKAAEILQLVDDLKNEAQAYSDTISGDLRIATIPGPMHLLVKTIANFKADYPLVNIELYEKGPKEILEDLIRDNADIGLIILNDTTVKYSRDLIFNSLLEGRMMAGVSKNSPVAAIGRISPELLREQQIALYDDEFIIRYLEEFTAVHGPVQILFKSNNTEAIQKAVADNIAITVGLDYSIRNHRDYLDKKSVLVDLDLPEGRIVQYGWVRKERNFSTISKLFLNRLEAEAKKADKG